MTQASSIPSVIAFEGVDGAGKSTVIARVAAHLRAQGRRVHMPRVGKEHDSRPTRMIRRVTRDPRNLALCSMSEFLLYCAREVQVLEEEVRPALARGETVLLDRTLLTPQIMATYGRGLPKDTVTTLMDHLGQGSLGALAPQLTLVFEVSTRTSRIRKRLAKVKEQGPRDPGRKGLSGTDFKERVRSGYIETAARLSLPHFCVEQMTPDELAEQVLLCLSGQEVTRTGVGEAPRWQVDPALSLEQALDELESVDPAQALYFSRGLICGRQRRARWAAKEPEIVGWSLDPTDPLFDSMLERVPEILLSNMAYRPWQGAQDPRQRLAKRHPQAVLAGLVGLDDADTQALRRELFERCPGEVVESLSGQEGDWAQKLRNEGWKQADAFQRAISLAGCSRDKNWRRRDKLFRVWPHLAVNSLRGLSCERSNEMLKDAAPQAPKSVLGALAGRQDQAAQDLREALAGTGREIIDSIRGLDDPHSWDLRERFVERWPSTVAWSLWGVPASDTRAKMLQRSQELAQGDLHVMRRFALFAEASSLPEWAWPKGARERGELSA